MSRRSRRLVAVNGCARRISGKEGTETVKAIHRLLAGESTHLRLAQKVLTSSSLRPARAHWELHPLRPKVLQWKQQRCYVALVGAHIRLVHLDVKKVDGHMRYVSLSGKTYKVEDVQILGYATSYPPPPKVPQPILRTK